MSTRAKALHAGTLTPLPPPVVLKSAKISQNPANE
jgi:hypothetical protein